ncbi:outer membrane protein assembly factor BamA [Buchnera aphidicola (Aphis glycines)]|uniref:Outer membrane protein assembly factor BamA n=2 Tax=Buchnera aphidicola TaxID=9 RepID=A0A0M5JR23_9GAMM|nr:outer membrane protein assembly factor BamA [Buchnera aphidicola (Aphis glycines)]
MLIKKFFILFLMFFSINIYSKNVWIIKNIEFQGLNHCSKEEVLKNILFNVGNKISKNDIKKTVKSLFNTGKFQDIKVFFSEKSLIFKIIERPLIYHINITGNHLIKSSVLNEYLNQLGISVGKQYNPYLKNIFISNIKDFYLRMGRYQVKIQFLTTFSSNNRINLKILIDEGNLFQINHVTVIGNKNVSQDEIISLFRLKNHQSWWDFLGKHVSYYNQLEENLNNLNKFYLNKGYYYFHIDKKIVNFLKHQNKVDIILHISEGERYTIDRVFINGNVFQYYEVIKNLITINNNELYNKEKIDLIIQKIKYFLSENGYINAQIVINPKINFQKKTIILNFDIDINQRYFVNKISFKGNELTKDIVLRREIKQMEGQWCNLKLINLGKTSLEKIKYLHDIKIIKNFVNDKSNAIDITYEVKEHPTGTINFGVGYGKDSGLSFNASLAKDNLFGYGNSFKTSIIKNDNQKYADLLFTYPYFFNNGTNLNMRFFYNDFKYHVSDMSALIKKTAGLESDLSFLINDVNRFNIGFGYTRNSLMNKNSVITEKKITNSINKKKFFTHAEKTIDNQSLNNSLVNDFTLNYSILHDTLKDFYFPISGNQTYLSGKNTIPGSDNNFYKFLLDTQQYIPLDQKNKFIFLAHFKAGFGDSLNQEKLPFYENFHSNNSNNIRGFRINTIGPKKSYPIQNSKECLGYKNNHSCESLDSIGGNAMVITNLELIVPIPFFKEENTHFFRSSFFLDAGNIWDTRSNQKNDTSSSNFIGFPNLKNIYSSVGFAVQWLSPVGPLMFSYAYPIQKNENNQLEAFQFNIGKNW